MSEERTYLEGGDIRPGDLVSRVESVVHAELDEALVMLDMDVGRYYELDSVAKRVWSLIEYESSVASVCEALKREYAVDGQTCLRDVLAFVGKMAEHGLVSVRPAEGRKIDAIPDSPETSVADRRGR